MNTLIILACIATVALSAPLDSTVRLDQSTDGSYQFTLITPTYTRTETRNLDGSVTGYFTYVDTDGNTHTINYTSGSEGFLATGADVPVPVVDLPEVSKARSEHVQLQRYLAANLPALRADGTVPEVEPVPLSKEQFLSALTQSLGNGPLTFVEDTPEISAAKAEHLSAQREALGL